MKITKLFNDKIFYKSLFTIAIPIMLQNLVNSFVNMVDTVMIGQLGTVEIAGVGLANNFFFLLNMLLFGAASGAGVFTAQFWGKKDIAGIRKNTGLCIIIVVLIASFFTLVSLFAPEQVLRLYTKDPAVIKTGAEYLKTVAPCFIPFAISFVFTLVMRTIEKVKLAMVVTVVSLSANMLLNWVLIFGIGPFPALGVKGAALATVSARLIEVILLVSISYSKKYALAGTLKELFGFDLLFVKRYFIIALPVIINELLWSVGVALQSVIFARTHTDAIAAFNIVNTLSQLTWVVFIGLGNGGSVLIGKKIGEGQEQTARDYASRLTLFAPLLAIGVALFIIPISWTLPLFFNVSENVFVIISGMIIILACSYPFRAFNMSMIIGVCRAGGDTVYSVFYDIIFTWLVTLPLAAAASFIFGLPAWVVYLCVASEDPLKMIFGIARLRSGKWLHNVT